MAFDSQRHQVILNHRWDLRVRVQREIVIVLCVCEGPAEILPLVRYRQLAAKPGYFLHIA